MVWDYFLLQVCNLSPYSLISNILSYTLLIPPLLHHPLNQTPNIPTDHITSGSGDSTPTQVKGDIFALIGATFYGLSNVFEEWFVSKRPMYEVLGMLGLFGIIINGITAAIFDRGSFRTATWDGQVGGYIVGYTLALGIFYSRESRFLFPLL